MRLIAVVAIALLTDLALFVLCSRQDLPCTSKTEPKHGETPRKPIGKPVQ